MYRSQILIPTLFSGEHNVLCEFHSLRLTVSAELTENDMKKATEVIKNAFENYS